MESTIKDKKDNFNDAFVKIYAELIAAISADIQMSYAPFENGGNGRNREIMEVNLPFLFRAMLKAMNDNEVFSFKKNIAEKPFDYTLWKYLVFCEKGYKKDNSEKNLPISTLLRYYTTPGSGKKDYACKNLKKRFDAIDYNYQRKILSAFLESNKTDRQWACKKLYYKWDPLFIKRIKNCWFKYQEKCLAFVIVKHFPSSFIIKELDHLSKLVDYWALCLRLGKHKSFIIKWNKLSLEKEFYVRAMLGIKDDKNLEKKFFKYMANQCEIAAKHFYLKQHPDDPENNSFYEEHSDVHQWAIQPWEVVTLQYITNYSSIIHSAAKLGMKTMICKITMIINDFFKLLGPVSEQPNGEEAYKEKSLKLLAQLFREQ